MRFEKNGCNGIKRVSKSLSDRFWVARIREDISPMTKHKVMAALSNAVIMVESIG